MRYEKFVKLPIGSVFIYENLGMSIVEVKISKNRTMTVNDYDGRSWDSSGGIDNYKGGDGGDLDCQELKVAPAWIRNCFKVI